MQLDQSVVCPVLIGRDAPLATARHTLERARAAHGSALLVSGEAGIGKSRLVRAMTESARSLGFVAIQGACFEADRAQPYAPVLDLVRVLAASASPALAAHCFAPAAAELTTIFPELRSIFPDVVPRQALDPEEERRRLFHSFTEAIHVLGRVQPLLVVVEDVHWSDDATLDLLLHVARHIGTQPTALVLTFRSDEVGGRLARLLADLDRARCASEVALRPLAAAEVSAMLQAIFGADAPLGAPFADRLHSLTEGNPFFVEEMLKSLLVSGDLARADDVWRARPLERVRVPRTATEAVGRRLAQLSEPARTLASVAAVAGRRFDFALLQAITPLGEGELLSILKELVDAQLVVEESADRFAFRHALTREAMRARLLARERVALHRSIAAALQAQLEHTPQDLDDTLAYHCFEAGEWESARRYALRAAAHASTLCAPREALQQLERAVTATTNTGRPAEPSLLLARGRTHETLGAFQQANDDFVAALSAAREEGDLRTGWEALHALGMLWAARDYDRAGAFRREALEMARVIGDPAIVARSLNRVGNWHVNREEPQAGIPHHDEALAIFERVHDQRGIAESVDLLAMAHHIAGTEETAAVLYERVIALFTALEDRRGLVTALSVQAACGPSYHASVVPVSGHAADGRLAASERAVHLATEIGWRAGEAFSRYLISDCFAWRGEFGRGIRLARESLSIAQEIEYLELQCGARRALGVIALDLNARPAAITHLRAAYDIARRLGSAIWTRWTGAPLAIALARNAEHDRGSAVLREIDAVVVPSPALAAGDGIPLPTLGGRYLAVARAEVELAAGNAEGALAAILDAHTAGTPRVALLIGEALAALGRWGEASASLGEARVEAGRQGARPLLWRIEAQQGRVHLGERRRSDARRAFDAARAIADELAAEIEEESLAAAFRAGVDLLAPPHTALTEAQAAREAHAGLTRREREVATLVAQGAPNRAIARTLGIGERTVEGHVAGALSKLGFSSRSQLAVWATAQRLTVPPANGTPPRR